MTRPRVALTECLGTQRFGTNCRYRDPATGMLTGEKLPIDLAANVEALGAEVVRVNLLDEFRAAIATARAAAFHHHIEIDPPARTAHQVHERDQKPLIGGVQP